MLVRSVRTAAFWGDTRSPAVGFFGLDAWVWDLEGVFEAALSLSCAVTHGFVCFSKEGFQRLYGLAQELVTTIGMMNHAFN